VLLQPALLILETELHFLETLHGRYQRARYFNPEEAVSSAMECPFVAGTKRPFFQMNPVPIRALSGHLSTRRQPLASDAIIQI
jgi:hypothetical protein